jgi:nucleoside permease NupC
MVKPIGCIIANLIAFRAIFQFIDAGFEWIFGNLGLKNFGLVVSYFYLNLCFLKFFTL